MPNDSVVGIGFRFALLQKGLSLVFSMQKFSATTAHHRARMVTALLLGLGARQK
jgi:hypothetical protein